MFTDRLALQIAKAAEANGIPKAGMLAIVEVETAGSPLESDGMTPNFLFERHIFHRELAARQPEKLSAAEAEGLAIPKWSKSTQYRDERTSAMRLELLSRVKAIDEDCALRACSWGLPQIMGNECSEIGFKTAKELVDYMTAGGVTAHIELMIRFLRSRNLISAIANKDWAYVALKYNGPAYAENHYDTRLETANTKWERKLLQIETAPVVDQPEESLSSDEVLLIQRKLRELGYVELGQPDGIWGPKTGAALWAFQHHEGLPTTGHYDHATQDALSHALPRPVNPARENTTVDDLRKDGSTTIASADKGETLGKGKIIAGGTIAAGTVLDQTGSILDKTQDTIDKVGQAKGIWASIHDLVHPLVGHWFIPVLGVALIAVGYFTVRYFKKVKASRLDDHQTGVHAGRF